MIKVERFVHFKNIFLVVFIAICSLVLSSCISDDYDDGDTTRGNVDEQLMLTFVVPNINVSTRAEEGYEDGSVYENLVDINNHDYSIYFFSYEGEEDESAGTFIAQFTPTRTTSSSSENETFYTVSGVVPDKLLDVNSFRVVVLANCGSYLDEAEITTIDDLTKGTFSASDKFKINADSLIPFYGVQEYSGVSFNSNETIELKEEVSLLRALAKVEIVLYDGEFTFSDVSLHNYNSEGYSAPEGIYLSSQYNHGDWDDDYVQTLHLVNGANDGIENSAPFIKTKDRVVTDGEVTQYETWDLYIPEYDNTTEGVTPSYIEVKFNQPLEIDKSSYEIYFYDYINGVLDEDNPWDIHRNNLYRFNVSLGEYGLEINVNGWSDAFDNAWTFGNMEESGEVKDVGFNFQASNGYEYEVTNQDEPEVKITQVISGSNSATYFGDVNIPQSVHYDGVDYKVTAIGEQAFYGCVNINSVQIPETILEIDAYAFSGCTAITEISLPESLITIGSYAFSECTALTTIIIPESVEEIGEEAFLDCTLLSSLTILGETKIGDFAFKNCDSIEEITALSQTPPSCGEDVFDSAIYSTCTLYVKNEEIKKSYEAIEPWFNFESIVALSD